MSISGHWSFSFRSRLHDRFAGFDIVQKLMVLFHDAIDLLHPPGGSKHTQCLPNYVSNLLDLFYACSKDCTCCHAFGGPKEMDMKSMLWCGKRVNSNLSPHMVTLITPACGHQHWDWLALACTGCRVSQRYTVICCNTLIETFSSFTFIEYIVAFVCLPVWPMYRVRHLAYSLYNLYSIIYIKLMVYHLSLVFGCFCHRVLSHEFCWPSSVGSCYLWSWSLRSTESSWDHLVKNKMMQWDHRS